MRRCLLVVALALVVSGACGDDDATVDDGSTAPAPPATTMAPLDCPEGDPAVATAVGVTPLGEVTFEEGVLRECLAVSNGSADDIAVRAIQVLPAEGEEPYVVLEATELTDAFGVGAGDDAVVVAGGTVVVAVQAFAPEPPGAIRHRMAYSDLAPQGRLERFVEGGAVAAVPLDG